MKRLLTLLIAIFAIVTASAQSEKSIIIDQNSFCAVQADALTGVNIDPIGVDSSRRPCARIKVKINRMTREEIDQIEVKIVTNNELRKCKTADYDNGLIIEMTAKPSTRFYFNHPDFGESNEVTLNLEPNKEYYMEASLNQTYSIVINTNVEGADIYLDGEMRGSTDASCSLTVREVLVGPHVLKVVYGGIEHEQKIEVNGSNISFRQTVDTQASEPQFVVFVVEPANAVVLIDNQPYSLEDGAMQVVLDRGTYTYTVTAAGYHAQSGTFAVAGEKVEKRIALTADAVKVALNVADNAEIWVNGVKKGIGSWSGVLNSGNYIFEAKKEGYKSSKISQHITSGRANQSFELPAPTPIYGSLVVSGTPISAEVTLDGNAVGSLPLKLNEVLVGDHTLEITKSGYESDKQRITVSEGKAVTLNISLKKQSVADLATTQSTQSAPQSTPKMVAGLTSAPYSVGDYYNDGAKEGIVFEVSADGQSGKIVSLAESPKMKLTSLSSWVGELGEGWSLPDIATLKKFALKSEVMDAVNSTLRLRNAPIISDKLYGSNTTKWQSINSIGDSDSYRMFFYYVSSNSSSSTACRKTEYYRLPDGYARAVASFSAANLAAVLSKYKVGDVVTVNGVQGIVYQTAPTVKLVSVAESSGKWSDEEFTTWARDLYNGAANMRRVKGMAGWQSRLPLFKWCDDLGKGWYLPAIEELRDICRQKVLINRVSAENGFTTLKENHYWSSTEIGTYAAQNLYFPKGTPSQSDVDKNFYRFYVRAVFEFKTETVVVNSNYKIGDIVTVGGVKGIVFQTYPKVKAVSIAESKAVWGPTGVTVGTTDNEDGAKNMEKVMAVSGWKKRYPAFKWCSDLGKGWYLPSGGELMDICNKRSILNQKLSAAGLPLIATHNWSYWSSTEYAQSVNEYNSSNYAYSITLGTENGGHASKSGDGYIRAVITF